MTFSTTSRAPAWHALIGLALIAAATPALSQDALTPAPGQEVTANVIDMQANYQGPCLLQEDNTLFCWAANPIGLQSDQAYEMDYQSLNAALNNNIKAFSLNNNALCAIGNEGGVACVEGELIYGEPSGVGSPPEPDATYIAISPITYSYNEVCAIQADNRVVCWGGEEQINNVPPTAQYLQQVDVSYGKACGIDLDNEIQCWGWNLYEGDNDSVGPIKAITLGPDRSSCVLKFDNTAQCYNISDFEDSIDNDRTFNSIKLQSHNAYALCFEETSGSKDCVAATYNNVSEEYELLSILPEDSNPAHVSSTSDVYIINEDGTFNSYYELDEVRSLFPTAPENLRKEVYSDNAIELFWDRASNYSFDSDYVTGYEIYRDDVLIALTGIQTSFFEGGLSNAARHNYAVRPLRVAIGGDASSLSSGTGGGSGPVAPEPPASSTPAPANLRSSVYSFHSAEIFWDRAADNRTTFDVYRDGVKIQSNMYGLSVYESNLQPSTIYHYSVIATLNGVQSQVADIHVTTPADANSPSPVVQAPANLTLTRYSSTALELFWDRPAAQSGIAKFEVYRNNELVRTLTGTSYFDDTANSGSSWTYSVVSIDTAGNSSVKTTVTE